MTSIKRVHTGWEDAYYSIQKTSKQKFKDIENLEPNTLLVLM